MLQDEEPAHGFAAYLCHHQPARGFTQAGERLGRSQPAVSLQMKRLEELLDAKLFNRGQGLQLTEEGQLLLSCAQKMLDLNDGLISRLGTPGSVARCALAFPMTLKCRFWPPPWGVSPRPIPALPWT
ncbi:LysR family transcriptional regulator [Oceanimonas sp. NS1]|nr:LysR family transcriptional regulator [Oceanimonas sp. NS1]